MIKINLVPAEILAKAQQKQQMIQAGVGAGFILLLVVGISVAHWFKLKRLERHAATQQAQLKKLEVVVAKVEELEKTAGAVRSRLSVITDLLKGRPLYPYFMSDFVRSVPMGVRVKSLSTSGGGSAAGPLKISLSADSRSNEDIAAWIKKLEQSGRFGQVEMGPVTAVDGAERVYTFTLISVYTPQL
ncbi:MAG: PilN domain-containing protein [Elusimicrobia bacterium]|nr:PilN domain-containing protein [Elusimicrobiota bacterium]